MFTLPDHTIASTAIMMQSTSNQVTIAIEGTLPDRQCRTRATERKAAQRKATTGSSACTDIVNPKKERKEYSGGGPK